MKRVFLAGAVAMAAGCSTGRIAGPPIVAANEKDAVWVTRSFEINGDMEKVVMHGLFACYRPPADKPGEPTCYLAKYVTGNGRVIPTDLEFPAQSRRAGRQRGTDDED